MTTTKTASASVTFLRIFVGVLFLCGLAGLLLTMLFGFETADDTMLLLSAALVLAPVVVVFGHLGATALLSPAQKRIWLRKLTGRSAPSAWGEYLSGEDLSAAAVRFEAEDSEISHRHGTR